MNDDRALCFVDSNVWLYALLELQDVRKKEVAKSLIMKNPLVISTQVINEVSRNLLKSGGFLESEIQEFVEAAYHRYRVVEFTKEMLLQASDLRKKHLFSFWDSLIVASALMANAQILYSEDMHHNLLVEGKLRVMNPFEKLVEKR